MSVRDSKKLVVIDGKSIFYRGYYAMPDLSTHDGTPTGGVYGFTVLALEIIKRLQPDYVCVAWDKSGTNIRKRKEIYAEYKAGRKKAPDDFYAQIPVLKELLESFSWPLYELDDYEADDIMATLAKKAEAEDIETVLVSSDLDLLQAITDKTTMFALKKGLSNIQEYNPAEYKKKFGVSVDQCVDFKALMGDSSDNIPGVAGVGKKTAADLLNKYRTLDGVYENLDQIKDSVRKKLEAGREMAQISKQLVTLMTDAPLDLDLASMDIKDLDAAKLREDLKRLEFNSLLRHLPEGLEDAAAAAQEAESDIKPFDKPAVQITESNAADMKAESSYAATIVSADDRGLLYVLTDTGGFYCLDLDDKKVMSIAAEADLFTKDHTIVAYDAKYILKALWAAGVQPIFASARPQITDISLGAFIRNSLVRDTSLEGLLSEFCGTHIDLADLSPEDRASVSLQALNKLAESNNEFFSDQKHAKLNKVYQDIDTPSIVSLARIEQTGMKLDLEYLSKMHEELAGAISDLEQSIYGHADKEFNINSPAQLADVLFETLELPTVGIKKGKTGYSTAASELAKLADKHEIIGLISEYRELAKLKSTYVDALPGHVADDGRVHSILSQTVASTGRLSSHDPNLQNIPVRSEMGKRVRYAFVAEDGHSIVSADYSQFELRLAAVLAGDNDMIEAFNSDIDIHTLTASQVFGVALEDVSKEQRYSAKAVNFGILYGQGSHGLAQQTGMSYSEAKEFIDKYFEQRSALRNYIKSLRDLAKEQGYVETLFGRRRPTPDVSSSNFMVREGAYRQAINMPIQGTEADLMKMAMLKLDELLDSDCRQIMQVHDSILVECPDKKVEAVAKLMRETMESIYPSLGIKLKVDVDSGKNWGEL
ncbi:MAG: DNA polymerase I [Patescibacteria group bacterium]